MSRNTATRGIIAQILQAEAFYIFIFTMNPEGIRFFNACKFKMMYKGPVGLLEK
jgi:hypothetical protein